MAFSENNQMYFVYILFCDQKTYYIGFTDNLPQRLKQHREKRSTYTKKFSEIILVHYEKYDTINEAKDQEKQLKKWSIAKKESFNRW